MNTFPDVTVRANDLHQQILELLPDIYTITNSITHVGRPASDQPVLWRQHTVSFKDKTYTYYFSTTGHIVGEVPPGTRPLYKKLFSFVIK